MADVNWGKAPQIDAQELDTSLPPIVLRDLKSLQGYSPKIERDVGLCVGRYRVWRRICDNHLAIEEHRALLQKIAKDIRGLAGTKGNPGSLRMLPRLERHDLTDGLFEDSELWGDPVETLVHRLDAFASNCISRASYLESFSSREGGNWTDLERGLLSEISGILENQLHLRVEHAANVAHQVLVSCEIKIGGRNPRRIVREYRNFKFKEMANLEKG